MLSIDGVAQATYRGAQALLYIEEHGLHTGFVQGFATGLAFDSASSSFAREGACEMRFFWGIVLESSSALESSRKNVCKNFTCAKVLSEPRGYGMNIDPKMLRNHARSSSSFDHG